MQALNPIFGEHPSEALKAAYKGYQGCNPEDASVIILGKDPNFGEHIANWQSFDELLYYLRHGLSNYLDYYKVVPFVHHPFLSNDYHADGYKYHNMFRRLFRECNKDGLLTNDVDHDKYKFYSKYISFVDILGIPTYGSVSIPLSKGMKATDAQKQLMSNARISFKNLLLGRENKQHLIRLNNWLFNPINVRHGKLILVSEGVHNLLKTHRNELFVKSEIFGVEFPTLFQDIYHDNNQNITIKSSIHLSSRNATKGDFAELYKLIEEHIGIYKPSAKLIQEACIPDKEMTCASESTQSDNSKASVNNRVVFRAREGLIFDDAEYDEIVSDPEVTAQGAFNEGKTILDHKVADKSSNANNGKEANIDDLNTPKEWNNYLSKKVVELHKYSKTDTKLEDQDIQLMIALVKIMNRLRIDLSTVRIVRTGQYISISKKGQAFKVFTNLNGMFSFTDFDTYAKGRTVVRIQRLDGDLDNSDLLKKKMIYIMT